MSNRKKRGTFFSAAIFKPRRAFSEIPALADTPLLLWRTPNQASRTLRALKKKIALLFADGQRELFHYLKHVLPNSALLAERLVAKHVGGMIGRHQRCAS